MDQRNSNLDDISAVIGFSATARLCSWFGRCNLYIPLTAEPDHAVAKLIGMSAMLRLCAAYKGKLLSIPSDRTTANDLRDRELAQMLGEGLTTLEIAQKIGISVRRVQQLRREIEASGLIPLVMDNQREKASRQIPPEKSPLANSSQKKPPAKPR